MIKDKIAFKTKVTISAVFETEIDVYEDIKNKDQYTLEVARERFKDNEDPLKIQKIESNGIIIYMNVQ